MEINANDLLLIIGKQTVELETLRAQLRQAEAKLAEVQKWFRQKNSPAEPGLGASEDLQAVIDHKSPPGDRIP